MIDQAEEDGADAAARAFQDLHAEVIVMRRLVEGLPHEWEDKRPPDYSPDLGAMRKALIAMEKRLEVIEGKPALKETLETYATRIENAGQSVFREPKQELGEAITEARKTRRELAAMIGHMRGKEEQRKDLLWIGLCTALSVFILTFVSAPLIYRHLPFGWDGTVAAIVMGQPDRVAAGSALMREANPSVWNQIVGDWNLISGNKANAKAVATCESEAMKSHKAQDCRIMVTAGK